MKKLITALLILCFICLIFSACQIQTPTENETTDIASTTEPEESQSETTEPEETEPPREKVEASYTYELKKSTKQYHFYVIESNYNDTTYRFQIRVPVVEAYEYEPEEAAARMDPQIATLNQMAQSSANVNLWVYVATCLEDSELMANIIPSEDLSSNYSYFASQLDPSIWVGHLDPFDIAERRSWYLSTDHHWSADGWYEAYTQLITAMRQKYSDISPREGERVLTSSLYYGSIGKDFGACGCDKDPFVFYNFGLPSHSVSVLKKANGKLLYASAVPFEENATRYLAGNLTSNEGKESYDHYVNFYPICKEVTYSENQTGRNMLFLGDSFSLGVQELIASHFDHSYFFYVDGTKDIFTGQDFTKFCQDNQITDVVIVEQSTRILYDYYDYSGPALASFFVK